MGLRGGLRKKNFPNAKKIRKKKSPGTEGITAQILGKKYLRAKKQEKDPKKHLTYEKEENREKP